MNAGEVLWRSNTHVGGYELEALGRSRGEALALLAAGYAEWSRRGWPGLPPFAEWCEGGEVAAYPLAVGTAVNVGGESLLALDPHAWRRPPEYPRTEMVTRQDGSRAARRGAALGVKP